ncbi:hypothetical protein E2C01_092478 [Portunus trituberculatus]|uniref:Uncharacterized protein n=1 Tax=Portunus trituberculatus TaxID=210409 RepID=A0A5B7JQN7_PORTR|nr:hypothetical protein [Portunus trituberculatus]
MSVAGKSSQRLAKCGKCQELLRHLACTPHATSRRGGRQGGSWRSPAKHKMAAGSRLCYPDCAITNLTLF